MSVTGEPVKHQSWSQNPTAYDGAGLYLQGIWQIKETLGGARGGRGQFDIFSPLIYPRKANLTTNAEEMFFTV